LKGELTAAGVAEEVGSSIFGHVQNPVTWNIMDEVKHDVCVTSFMELGTQVHCSSL
jgi:hypothetical protein